MSTHCLVPVGQPVVVVLQQPAAVLGQALHGLQPQPAGQLLTAAASAAASAAAATDDSTSQGAHASQLQHRGHEDKSQAAVPRHGGNTVRRGSLRKFSVLLRWGLSADWA